MDAMNESNIQIIRNKIKKNILFQINFPCTSILCWEAILYITSTFICFYFWKNGHYDNITILQLSFGTVFRSAISALFLEKTFKDKNIPKKPFFPFFLLLRTSYLSLFIPIFCIWITYFFIAFSNENVAKDFFNLFFSDTKIFEIISWVFWFFIINYLLEKEGVKESVIPYYFYMWIRYFYFPLFIVADIIIFIAWLMGGIETSLLIAIIPASLIFGFIGVRGVIKDRKTKKEILNA